MIEVQIDCEAELRRIEQQLGNFKKSAPNVLARAVNQTAQNARKKLALKAQETYAIKNGRFNKEMQIQRATTSRPAAVIRASGHAQELKDFKVSPARYDPHQKPNHIRSKVLTAGPLKPLMKGDIKSFIVKFRSGHVTVAQRTGTARLPVRVLYSLSIPTMLGSERRVYGLVAPDIHTDLQANIDKQITRILARGGR